MRIDLTDLSYQAFQQLASPDMDSFHACQYLESKLAFREFYPTLSKIYPSDDLQERLVAAFSQANADLDPRSSAKKIRNWVNLKNVPNKREDIYILAFGLHLTESQTSYLLGFVSDYGIHYREPRELAFSYCLRTGRNYQEALRFFERLPKVPKMDKLPASGLTAFRTQTILELFSDIREDSQFLKEYQANLTNFGILHLRSYDYFIEYFRYLVNPFTEAILDPASADFKAEKYSIETVVKEYLTLCMPLGKKRSTLSLIQKMLKDGWPNATSLTNILNHKENVSRKLLLLLYLATENVLSNDYDELDEEYLTPSQRLDEHWWRINLILDECGMNVLDPRFAYDWLVLYSLNADPDEVMQNRMEQVIQYMFP